MLKKWYSQYSVWSLSSAWRCPPKAEAQVAFGVQIGAQWLRFKVATMKATTTKMAIAIRETLADTGTMTTHTVDTATGKMTAPTGTETIMTSITQMATIATGKDNGDHNNHGHAD